MTSEATNHSIDSTNTPAYESKSTEGRANRKHASAACQGCRQRRIRCVVSPGQTRCNSCLRTGVLCVFAAQDYRKIPYSRAHTENLVRRITLLEKSLQDHGVSISTYDEPMLSPPETLISTESTPRWYQDGNFSCQAEGFPGWRQLLGRLSSVIPPSTPYTQIYDKASHSLDTAAYDYLMGLFWDHFNSIFPVTNPDTFETNRRKGDIRYYSVFLHTCMLAIGYRYADKSRPGIRHLALSNRESCFHRDAKQMLDRELETPAGVPLVIALLLLGDLEWAVGRERQSWLLGRVAIRIAMDAEIDQDPEKYSFSIEEIGSRRKALRACILCDQIWALMLGCSRSNPDSSISDKFSGVSQKHPISTEQSIHEALFQLMRLTCRDINNLSSRISNGDGNASYDTPNRTIHLEFYYHLGYWSRNLADDAQWTLKNVAVGVPAFFLLHQQYHANILSILLHMALSGNHFVPEVTMHAIWIARILQRYRSCSTGNCLFSTALLHAGIAAKALLLSLDYTSTKVLRNEIIIHLREILDLLTEMSENYALAERMEAELREALKEWQIEQEESCILHSTELASTSRSVARSKDLGEHEIAKRTIEHTVETSLNQNTSYGYGYERSGCDLDDEKHNKHQKIQYIDISGESVQISTKIWQVLTVELYAGIQDGTIWSA